MHSKISNELFARGFETLIPCEVSARDRVKLLVLVSAGEFCSYRGGLLLSTISSLAGIANALDLTDRILPRLQMRPRCKLLSSCGNE